MDRGQIDRGATGYQAAAEGARIVALSERAAGNWKKALEWEKWSFEVEQVDPQAAAVGWLACGAVTAPARDVTETVAAYSVIYPGFLPEWLTHPALTLRSSEGSSAVVDLANTLRDRQRAAVAARESHVQFWIEGLASAGDHASEVQRAYGRAFTVAPTSMPVSALADRLREQYQAISRADGEVRKYLAAESARLLRAVTERGAQFAQREKASYDQTSTERQLEIDAVARKVPANRATLWGGLMGVVPVAGVVALCAGCFGGSAIENVGNIPKEVAGPALMAAVFGAIVLAWVVENARQNAAARRLADLRAAAADAEQAHQQAIRAASTRLDSLQRDLASAPALIKKLGHPPFIDGASYSAISNGLAATRMAATEKQLRPAEVWQGFESTHADWRRPPLVALAAIWKRALDFEKGAM